MDTIRISLLAIFATALMGCTTMGRINDVSVGMSKAQAIEKLGEPDSLRADEGSETLVYYLSEAAFPIINKPRGEYWVVLKNDKVIKYGRMGTFVSHEDARATQNAITQGYNSGLNNNNDNYRK